MQHINHVSFGPISILAFAQTEIQDGKFCGIILVQRSAKEWVTAWYRDGDTEWCFGDYFYSLAEGQKSFLQRVTEKWNLA